MPGVEWYCYKRPIIKNFKIFLLFLGRRSAREEPISLVLVYMRSLQPITVNFLSGYKKWDFELNPSLERNEAYSNCIAYNKSQIRLWEIRNEEVGIHSFSLIIRLLSETKGYIVIFMVPVQEKIKSFHMCCIIRHE